MKRIDKALDAMLDLVGMVLLGGMIAATGTLPILLALVLFENVTGIRIPCPFVPSLAL